MQRCRAVFGPPVDIRIGLDRCRIRHLEYVVVFDPVIVRCQICGEPAIPVFSPDIRPGFNERRNRFSRAKLRSQMQGCPVILVPRFNIRPGGQASFHVRHCGGFEEISAVPIVTIRLRPGIPRRIQNLEYIIVFCQICG